MLKIMTRENAGVGHCRIATYFAFVSFTLLVFQTYRSQHIEEQVTKVAIVADVEDL
jgi:hypothetical protein